MHEQIARTVRHDRWPVLAIDRPVDRRGRSAVDATDVEAMRRTIDALIAGGRLVVGLADAVCRMRAGERSPAAALICRAESLEWMQAVVQCLDRHALRAAFCLPGSGVTPDVLHVLQGNEIGLHVDAVAVAGLAVHLAQACADWRAAVGRAPTLVATEMVMDNLAERATWCQAALRCGLSIGVTGQRGAASPEMPTLLLPCFDTHGAEVNPETWAMGRATAPEASSGLPHQALMLAFHFPPQSGSSGILRTLNFVGHLPEHGWQAQVLSVSPSAHTECSLDLVPAISPVASVNRAGALDASRHLSWRGRYLRAMALPDRWSSWWWSGVRKGRQIIRERRPDLLWSTFPIHSAHAIAASLARWSGLPWVADFRDPMTAPHNHADIWQRWSWGRLERRTVDRAAVCVFTTERARASYAARYPEHEAKFVVIANGYEERAFDSLQPDRHGCPPQHLLLLHSGLIYPRERDPAAFFAAVAAMVADGGLPRNRVCLRFRAPRHGDDIRRLADQHGLGDLLEIGDPLPYREALAEMMAADLLLVFQGRSFNEQIPAKVYEYLRAMKPILALTDHDGDMAALLRGFSAVWCVDMTVPNEIRDALKAWVLEAGSGRLAAALVGNRERVSQHSREAQAAQLARLFDSLTATRGPA